MRTFSLPSPRKCRQCPERAVARGLCRRCLARDAYHPLRLDRRRRRGGRRPGPFDYDAEAWKRVSRAFLAEHPLCQACAVSGRSTPAAIVDHILPVRWYPELAWSETNYQALCTRRPWSCHQRKSGYERRGIALDFRRRRRVPIVERMTGGSGP